MYIQTEKVENSEMNPICPLPRWEIIDILSFLLKYFQVI